MVDSTGSKGQKPRRGDTEAQDQVRRMNNIMAKVGCPHGRLYPQSEQCPPCASFEASMWDPTID